MADLFLFLNLVVGVILFINRKTQANICLGLVFLLNGLQGLSHNILFHRFDDKIIALLFYNLAPLSFLIGPLLYFYTKKQFYENFRIKRIELFHLIPFFICLFFLIPYFKLSFEDKIKLVGQIRTVPIKIFTIKHLIGNSMTYFFARPIHILIYCSFSLSLLVKKKSSLINRMTSFQSFVLIKWLQILLISFAIIYTCNLSYMIWVYFTNKLELINPISFVAALTIGFLNIQIFLNPYILYGFKNIKYYSNDSILAKMYKININSNSLFSQEWEIDLLNKIKSLESEKKFTKKGYNLTKMASDLDIPKYQLIYFFREISDESFTEWKNRKRILFAIQLIDKGYLNTLTVETLSQECGYKSRSNFSLAFLHSTGKKLSDYVK